MRLLHWSAKWKEKIWLWMGHLWQLPEWKPNLSIVTLQLHSSSVTFIFWWANNVLRVKKKLLKHEQLLTLIIKRSPLFWRTYKTIKDSLNHLNEYCVINTMFSVQPLSFIFYYHYHCHSWAHQRTTQIHKCVCVCIHMYVCVCVCMCKYINI